MLQIIEQSCSPTVLVRPRRQLLHVSLARPAGQWPASILLHNLSRRRGGHSLPAKQLGTSLTLSYAVSRCCRYRRFGTSHVGWSGERLGPNVDTQTGCQVWRARRGRSLIGEQAACTRVAAKLKAGCLARLTVLLPESSAAGPPASWEGHD